MTEFDDTSATPPTPPEPDERDLARGDADGSTRKKPALEDSLEDAGDVTGRQTHDEDPPVS